MYAAVAGQAHEVDVLACLLGVLVCADDFRVLQDAAVGTSAVDFHQVLIDDATCTDVEVTHLAIAHLPVGQTDVFAACQELAVRISLVNLVEVRSRSVEDDIPLAVSANAPAVEDHQKSFLCHNVIYYLIIYHLPFILPTPRRGVDYRRALLGVRLCGCKGTTFNSLFIIPQSYFFLNSSNAGKT